VTVPFDLSKVKVERIEKGNSLRVEIRDKNTGELLEAYGEKVEPLTNNVETKNFVSLQNSGVYTTHTIYKERVDGAAVSRLYTVLTIYTYGSFRQIDKVNYTYWVEASSGPWELRDKYAVTISRTGSFPTTAIETSGTATIVVTTNTTITGSFSIEYLKSIGFTISYVQNNVYYLRKNISLTYVYSVY
jgi:hypothetical protein